MKKNVICIWCGEELRFEKEKGWVHQDGSVYKMECKDCGFIGQVSIHCPHCKSKNYIDNHCVLPSFTKF